MAEVVAVLDFGSQYTQVIARRLRECQVYSKVLPFSTSAEELKKEGIKGVILSGGPSSVFADNAPHPDKAIFDLGVPVLGICYGIQLLGYLLGGKAEHSEEREYGKGTLSITGESPLFKGINKTIQVWNSHGDKLTELPEGFSPVATTENSDFAAIQDIDRQFFGLQFHPEVFHTEQGTDIIRNFVFDICKCAGDWTMESYIESSIASIRETVGDKKVILGLSGGVDSSVAAKLIHDAIGPQLTCVFVDNGLLRKDEREAVKKALRRSFPNQPGRRRFL